MKTLSLILLLLIPSLAWGELEESLLSMVAKAESTNCPDKISKDGGYGLYQVTQPLLDHYNDVRGTTHVLDDMLCENTCHTVALWYLKWINHQLERYGYIGDKYRIICAYNLGWGRLMRNGFVIPDFIRNHPNDVYREFYGGMECD